MLGFRNAPSFQMHSGVISYLEWGSLRKREKEKQDDGEVRAKH